MSMYYIGIDLGGTKISGAVFSIEGTISVQKECLIEKREGREVGDLLCSLIMDLCRDGKIKVNDRKSIGVCVPGISYSGTGYVWAPNIPGWDHYPLKDEISSAIPNSIVTIESDRTCYILGETVMGVARGCRNAVFIAVGTGIGAGILVDDRVLHGFSDIVGAIGWMALKPPYSKQYDQCGCFETHCSGEGIGLQARLMLKADWEYNGILSEKKISEITSYDVFAALKRKDIIAKKVIDQAVEMWGMAAANLVSIFNPEMVVFGGGIFGPAVPLIPRIYKEACKWAQPISIRQVKFTATALPKLAGLYGAGAVSIKFAQDK